VDAAVDFAAEQPCGFQYAEMFRDGGKGDVKRGGQFANRGFSLSKTGEDSATSRIREGGEGGVEMSGGRSGIVNHKV
jgi:hypothetical protein